MLLILLFSSITTNLYSEDVIDRFEIGDRVISIPPPPGFHLVSPDMTAVNELNLSVTDTLNDLVANYIHESEVAAATNGELPPLLRTFSVKINKEFKYDIIGEQDFADLVNAVTLQNQSATEQIEYEISRQADHSGLSLKEKLDIEAALKFSTIIPLPVHLSAKQAFAHSMYINYNETGAENVVASTLTFVNIGGSVLFLYAFAPKQDLEWTREASLNWLNDTLLANQQPVIKIKPDSMNANALFALLVLIILFLVLLLLKRRHKGKA